MEIARASVAMLRLSSAGTVKSFQPLSKRLKASFSEINFQSYLHLARIIDGGSD
jgi:hypothetical protein